MSGATNTRKLPARQRSIYEPHHLEAVRAAAIAKPAVVERDDSYSNSLYANRQAYYMQDGSNHSAGETLEDSSGHSQGSSQKRRYLKKLNKRASNAAADLAAVYMLRRGLDSVSD